MVTASCAAEHVPCRPPTPPARRCSRAGVRGHGSAGRSPAEPRGRGRGAAHRPRPDAGPPHGGSRSARSSAVGHRLSAITASTPSARRAACRSSSECSPVSVSAGGAARDRPCVGISCTARHDGSLPHIILPIIFIKIKILEEKGIPDNRLVADSAGWPPALVGARAPTIPCPLWPWGRARTRDPGAHLLPLEQRTDHEVARAVSGHCRVPPSCGTRRAAAPGEHAHRCQRPEQSGHGGRRPVRPRHMRAAAMAFVYAAVSLILDPRQEPAAGTVGGTVEDVASSGGL